MKKNSLFPYFVIAFIALTSRLPLIEKFQSHWDGPDYSIAVVRFSLEQNTPTPPGYPLFIGAAKFFNIFVTDPHTSVVLVSVLGSIVGAIAFYAFGKSIYNKFVGIGATAIFLTASSFYYLSLTPYGYVPITAAIVVLGLSTYRIFILKKQDWITFGIALGILFGIRPQEIFLVGPLALLGFLYLKRRNKIKTLLIFAIITLIWLLPIIKDSGGIQSYIALNTGRFQNGGFTHSFSYNLPLAIKGMLLTTGISMAFLAYFPYKYLFKKPKFNKKIILFYAVWIIPGVIFNLFIRGEHAGYQVSYLSAVIILISYSMWAVFKKRTNLLYASLILVSLFNLYWFFYDRDPNFTKPYRPTSFHYSDIRKNDLIIGGKVNYVKNNFNPSNTMLLSTEASWRQYSYYLKNYPIVALNTLDNTQKPYIYSKYEGKNWDQKSSIKKDFTLKIPNNISNVILMDSPMNEWTKEKNKVIKLPANSKITILRVGKDSKILYDYHFIKIEN